jgi:methionine-rich copper-binding protein CopC
VTFASGSIKDLANNNYAGTTTYDFRTVASDRTAPTVTSFSPGDGATGVAASSNIVLTFSEAIARGTGNIVLRAGSATGTAVETFDAATSTRLTLSGSTLTIDPTSNLAGNTQYFVTFASGSIKDLANNNYAGTTTYDFRTTSTPSLFSEALAAESFDAASSSHLSILGSTLMIDPTSNFAGTTSYDFRFF